MNLREAIYPQNAHALYKEHGYAPAARTGDFLFVSGQVGAKLDGSAEPDLAKQAELAFDNLRAVLAAAGCTLRDVVDVTLFLVNPEQTLATILPIVRKNLDFEPLPALTGVGVTWLSGFAFEVKAIARIPA